MSQETKYFPLEGGLDLITPRISVNPGSVIDSQNFEVADRGYQRIGGFERFDGQAKPSDWTYTVIPFTAGEREPTVNEKVYGVDSGRYTYSLDSNVESGSWAGDDAEGVIRVDNTPSSVEGLLPNQLATWGSNRHGRLGNGEILDSGYPLETTPVRVGPNLVWSKVISMGEGTACLDSTGALYATGMFGWEDDVPGSVTSAKVWNYLPFYINADNNMLPGSFTSTELVRCGTGTFLDFMVYRSALTPTNAGRSSVAHAGYIKPDYTLWMWGDNSAGQVGDGTTTYRSSPVQIVHPGGRSWVSVWGGNRCTFAVDHIGSLSAWGEGTSGRTCLNGTGSVSTPTYTTIPSSVVQVASGQSGNGYAITTAGTLHAWGENGYGQLGIGSTADQINSVQVGSSTNWTEVRAMPESAIALNSAGGLFAWGRDVHGSLCKSSPLTVSSPVQIAAFSTVQVSSIAALNTPFGFGGAAVEFLGFVMQWGDALKAVGVAEPENGTPVLVSSDAYYTDVFGGDAIAAKVFDASVVGVLEDGLVKDPYSVTTGEALVYGNTAFGWGTAPVGDNTNVNRSSPVQIGATVGGFKKVVGGGFAGSYHYLALRSGGLLYAWGENGSGQLGVGDTTDRSSPTQVGSERWLDIACMGLGGSAGIRDDGTLWRWGTNLFSTPWGGSSANRSSPVQVGSSALWRKITAGRWSVLALREDGSLWGAGYNSEGELGDGTTTIQNGLKAIGPTRTLWADVILATAASPEYTSAFGVRMDGTLWAWGANPNGELGLNTTGNRSSPTQIGSRSDWVAVSSGGTASGAITSTGELFTWGSDNTYGQLGHNTVTPRSSPVQVGSGTDWAALAMHPAEGGLFIKTDGTAWACGKAIYTAAGGSGVNRSSPIQIGSGATYYRACGGPANLFALTRDTLGITLSAATDRGATTLESDQAWLSAEQGGDGSETRREAIEQVPGSGPVRGVWVFNGRVVAFRDDATGQTGGMWVSSPTGWEQVDTGRTLAFTSGSDFIPPGSIITGATSSATAEVTGMVIQSGTLAGTDAAGFLTIVNQTGVFQAETINTGWDTDSCSIAGNSVANDLHPGGEYDFVNFNFYGSADRNAMYGCNGLNKAFVWDGTSFMFIPTGMTADAPTHVAAHANSLFLSFRGGSVQISSTGDPLTWDIVTGAGEFSVGSDVVSLLSFAKSLVIVSEASIYALYGTSASDWDLQILSRQSGALPHTVQVLKEPVFMDDAGVRMLSTAQEYGDFKSGLLTPQIEPLFRDKRRAGVRPSATVRSRSKNLYRVFFEDGTALSVYIPMDGVSSALEIDYGMVVTCACSAEDTDGSDLILFGSDTGYVYQAEVGTSFDSLSIASHLQLPYNHLGSPNIVKRWHSISFETEGAPGSPLELDVGFDYSDPTTVSVTSQESEIPGSGVWSAVNVGTSLWATPSARIVHARIAGHGTNASLRISSDSAYDAPFTIHGVTIGYTNRRVVR